jgi:hypothetical protein
MTDTLTPSVCNRTAKDCDPDPMPPKVLQDRPIAATLIADKVDRAMLGAPHGRLYIAPKISSSECP